VVPAGPTPPNSGGSAFPSTSRIARGLTASHHAALADLYVRVTPAIHAYASLRLGERWVGPEDIVAEVWCRVAAHLRDYDPSQPFRGWVFGFARRVVKEAQRRMARSKVVTGRSDESSASSILGQVPASITSASSRAARNEDLRDFIAWMRTELSEYEREVMLLRGLQGRALSEVADALGRGSSKRPGPGRSRGASSNRGPDYQCRFRTT
jgi:RNA polymerase sigma factor (sigma-70 family)